MKMRPPKISCLALGAVVALVVVLVTLPSPILAEQAPQDAGGALDCETVRAAPADSRAVSATFHEWEAAIRSGDVPALLELVTEDAEFWTSSQPALRGRQPLQTAFETLFSRFEMEQGFECRELIVAGSWAFVRGTERNRLTPKAEGEPVLQSQRAFSVLHREDEGVWRFARGMTNRPPETGATGE